MSIGRDWRHGGPHTVPTRVRFWQTGCEVAQPVRWLGFVFRCSRRRSFGDCNDETGCVRNAGRLTDHSDLDGEGPYQQAIAASWMYWLQSSRPVSEVLGRDRGKGGRADSGGDPQSVVLYTPDGKWTEWSGFRSATTRTPSDSKRSSRASSTVRSREMRA